MVRSTSTCVLQPYGVNQVGPVIRFRTTTSKGDTEIGVCEYLITMSTWAQKTVTKGCLNRIIIIDDDKNKKKNSELDFSTCSSLLILVMVTTIGLQLVVVQYFNQ